MNTKLMSIDSSSSSSGVSIWINGKFSHHFLVTTDKGLKGDEKLNQMILYLYEVIDTEQPDILVTECTVVLRNPQVQRMLTEILGAIRGKCVADGISYSSLRPTEWRKAVTNVTGIKPSGRKREDLKAWSLDVVNNKLDIPTKSDDESDAVLIGYAYNEAFNRGDEL